MLIICSRAERMETTCLSTELPHHLHYQQQTKLQRVHEKVAQYGYQTGVKASSQLQSNNQNAQSHGLYSSLSNSVKTWLDQAADSLDQAHFDVWSDTVIRYCDQWPIDESLQIVDAIDRHGLCAPIDMYSHLLDRCIKERDLIAGRKLNYYIVQSGLDTNSYLGCFLIRLFSITDSVLEVKKAFQKISSPTLFSWTAVISAHVRLGLFYDVILLFEEMNAFGIKPDGHVFVEVLKACSRSGSLDQADLIHASIIENGFECNQYVGAMLVDMYCKNAKIQYAETVFHRLPYKDVVTWSTLIAGYVEHGYAQEGLLYFLQMQEQGIYADNVAFTSALQACLCLGDITRGAKIHKDVICIGLESDKYVVSALVDMYARCGKVKESRWVFDNVLDKDLVVWSAMVAGYAQEGHGHMAVQHGKEAIKLFKQMQKEGIKPDDVIYVSALQACSSENLLEEGQEIHMNAIESGVELDLFVGNTLIDMYGKCGCIDAAGTVFQKMPEKDLITWSALITGYGLQGFSQKALQLFHEMQEHGYEPTEVTFLCILQACSSVAAQENGIKIHRQILEHGFESELIVANTLVDMYIKCGSLDNAYTLFQRIPTRDAVTWTALLSGHALCGDYAAAAQCFTEMCETGLKPTGVTYLNLLSACSHVGLVNEGCLQFKLMRERYQLLPTLEHFTTMIDLLGRAGYLDEAEDLLESLPDSPTIVSWTSLLGSCRRHRNVNVGKRSFDRIVSMDARTAGGYVLMSNIYSDAGLREQSQMIEEMRIIGNVWKKPAVAYIEVDDVVHDFIVGDDTHPRMEEINAKLSTVSMLMNEQGHTSSSTMVLDPLTKEKEDSLCGHSERLALAFGLINLPQGSSIRVAKNLRVCQDCHNFTRNLSKIEDREIIINDAYCIHRFKDGICSCKEYV